MGFLQKVKGFVSAIGDRALGRRKKELYDLAVIHGEGVKKAIINTIKNHEVSQDLLSHKQSNYLNGRKGTLFGFLGFHAGRNPVKELTDFLDDYLKIEPKTGIDLQGIFVSIKLPPVTSAVLLKAKLSLPWQPSKAWPYAIEENISNLPFFLSTYTGEKSLSKEGIQLKKAPKNLTAEFEGVSYLTDILKNSKRLVRVKKFRL